MIVILYGNNMLASMCVICGTNDTSDRTVKSFYVPALDCITSSEKLDKLKFLTATLFTKLLMAYEEALWSPTDQIYVLHSNADKT